MSEEQVQEEVTEVEPIPAAPEPTIPEGEPLTEAEADVAGLEDIVAAAEGISPEKTNGKLKVTSAAEWKKITLTRFLVTLPSGVVVKVRRPDMPQLMSRGLLDAKSFLEIAEPIDKPVPGVEGVSEDEFKAQEEAYSTQTVERMVTLEKMAAQVAPHIVSEPLVLPRGEAVPEGVGEADVAYVDEIPSYDLVQLLLWSMGRANVEFEEIVDEV